MLATFPGITKNQIMNFLLGHSDIVCVWASFFATVGSVRSLMVILFEQALIRIPIQKSAHQIVHGQRYKGTSINNPGDLEFSKTLRFDII